MASKTIRLDQPYECRGVWWLPEDPQHQMAGVMRYDGAEDLRLHLIGAFSSEREITLENGWIGKVTNSPDQAVIHGKSRGVPITLLNASVKIFKTNLSPDLQTLFVTEAGTAEQELDCRYAIIGAHVKSLEAEEIGSFETHIEGAHVWSGHREIRHTMNRKNAEQAIVVPCTNDPTAQVEGTTYRLRHSCVVNPDSAENRYMLNATQTTWFEVRPERPISVARTLSITHELQELIAVASHGSPTVYSILVHSAAAGDNAGEHSSAYVLYASPRRSRAEIERPRRNAFLFTCEDIPFATVLPAWLRARRQLESSLNIMMANRYAPHEYVEPQLLAITGAAEVLHRNLGIGKPPFNEQEFKRHRDAVLAELPADYKKYFKKSLRNEPTLRERLMALHDRLAPSVASAMVPDASAWAKATTRARNNLTHEGNTSRQSSEELWAICAVTEAIIMLNVLHELGITTELLLKLTQTNDSMSGARRQALDLFSTDSAQE